jgi:hypothetical protein
MVKKRTLPMPLGGASFQPSPIPVGLTIVSIPASSSLPYLRHVLTIQARGARPGLGVPMPVVSKVLSLFSAMPRAQELAIAVERAFRRPKFPLADHESRALGSTVAFDWISNEGLTVLLPLVDSAPGWIILEWHVQGQLNSAMAEGLLRLANAARARNTRIMLLAVGLHDPALARLCQEYFVVRDCEPNPDEERAFAVECWGLQQLSALGTGRFMIRLRRTAEGLVTKSEVLISETLQVRFMAKLRAAGDSMEVISKAVRLNKSSVSRALQGLPPMDSAPMTEMERKLWQEALWQHRSSKENLNSLQQSPE